MHAGRNAEQAAAEPLSLRGRRNKKRGQKRIRKGQKGVDAARGVIDMQHDLVAHGKIERAHVFGRSLPVRARNKVVRLYGSFQPKTHNVFRITVAKRTYHKPSGADIVT